MALRSEGMSPYCLGSITCIYLCLNAYVALPIVPEFMLLKTWKRCKCRHRTIQFLIHDSECVICCITEHWNPL